MPEELAIGLALIIGAIWLLVKIGQGISAAIDLAIKSHYKASARRSENRRAKARDRLQPYVHSFVPNELDKFGKQLEIARFEFEERQRKTKWIPHVPGWVREQFRPVPPPHKNNGYAEMCIDEIDAILSPTPASLRWSTKEHEIVSRQCKYPSRPPTTTIMGFVGFPTLTCDLKAADFKFDAAHITEEDVNRYFSDEQSRVLDYNKRRAELIAQTASLNSAIEGWIKESRAAWESYNTKSKQAADSELTDFHHASESYVKSCRDENKYFEMLLQGHKEGKRECVVKRFDYVLESIRLPDSVPHTWDTDFDEEQKIALIEIGLPDVVHRPPTKTVVLKSGAVRKPLNQNEKKELIPRIHPAILLRIAYEVFQNDTQETIKLLALNGWVRFDDPATGADTKAYTASLLVERNQITALNLSKIDPLAAFDSLHGKSAGKLVEIIPIEPMLSLNRKDSRFVDAKEVLSGLGTDTNLAAMDWQDFEHLIRELFEKEFSGRGAEVKITQASRDRGVDAIVFDPDPIHGGKYVIQAKRYTNTVDVSAVRDLCAVVKKEGASRGILVTTSTYGADAYAFANNEPVTLLNGAELLGLLRKHGYTFRINLAEARRSA
jgi:restriction system protein